MADNAELREALENIANMVIPDFPTAIPVATDGRVVKLDFVIAMRQLARDAIGWQPDYLQQQLERK